MRAHVQVPQLRFFEGSEVRRAGGAGGGGGGRLCKTQDISGSESRANLGAQTPPERYGVLQT